MAKRIVAAMLGVLMVGTLVGVFYLTNTDNASTWYVQVDDAVAQDKSDEGEEVWEYTLDAYDEGGTHRQLTFTAGKRLRDDAYLKLRYLPVREVISWEEVQIDELPQAVRERLPSRSSATLLTLGDASASVT